MDLPRSSSGQRRQRLIGGFRTKADAEKALALLVVEIEQGVAVDPSRLTLGEYLNNWLNDIEPSLRPTTAALYRLAVRSWITPCIGEVTLQALTPKHLQDLYTELLSSGRAKGKGRLSPGSARLAHQVIHQSLERAVDWQMLARNPATLSGRAIWPGNGVSTLAQECLDLPRYPP